MLKRVSHGELGEARCDPQAALTSVGDHHELRAWLADAAGADRRVPRVEAIREQVAASTEQTSSTALEIAASAKTLSPTADQQHGLGHRFAPAA